MFSTLGSSMPKDTIQKRCIPPVQSYKKLAKLEITWQMQKNGRVNEFLTPLSTTHHCLMLAALSFNCRVQGQH